MPWHGDLVRKNRKMLVLLYEFPAETRLTVYRRLDIRYCFGSTFRGKNFLLYELCRTGGKPSTWFPPGNRRADHLSMICLWELSSLWRSSNHYFQDQPKLSTIFIEVSKFSSFFIIFSEHTLRLLARV